MCRINVFPSFVGAWIVQALVASVSLLSTIRPSDFFYVFTRQLKSVLTKAKTIEELLPASVYFTIKSVHSLNRKNIYLRTSETHLKQIFGFKREVELPGILKRFELQCFLSRLTFLKTL